MIFERPHSLVGPKPGMGIYLRVFIPELWLFYVFIHQVYRLLVPVIQALLS